MIKFPKKNSIFHQLIQSIFIQLYLTQYISIYFLHKTTFFIYNERNIASYILTIKPETKTFRNSRITRPPIKNQNHKQKRNVPNSQKGSRNSNQSSSTKSSFLFRPSPNSPLKMSSRPNKHFFSSILYNPSSNPSLQQLSKILLIKRNPFEIIRFPPKSYKHRQSLHFPRQRRRITFSSSQNLLINSAYPIGKVQKSFIVRLERNGFFKAFPF